MIEKYQAGEGCYPRYDIIFVNILAHRKFHQLYASILQVQFMLINVYKGELHTGSGG